VRAATDMPEEDEQTEEQRQKVRDQLAKNPDPPVDPTKPAKPADPAAPQDPNVEPE
jgi:hypothetical protein